MIRVHGLLTVVAPAVGNSGASSPWTAFLGMWMIRGRKWRSADIPNPGLLSEGKGEGRGMNLGERGG